MTFEQTIVKFLNECEGCKLTAYRDTANLLTIGVGHLLTKSELSSGKIVIGNDIIKWSNGITQKQADYLLLQDIKPASICIDESVHVTLLPNHKAALVSFVFNVGQTAFKNSTLLKVLNIGDYGQVPKQLLRWTKNHYGQTVQGLVNRREKEIALWKSA